MKKLSLLFIGVLSMSNIVAQDISDAVRYSVDEIQGTARFRAMSGAFGALGGDMSAVNINPAGSAIFTLSHASVTLSSLNINNDVNYYDGMRSSSDSKFDLNQAGAVFVFNRTNQESNWKKFALSVAYDKTANFENNWIAAGNGENTVGNYFLAYAQGLRLDEISALPGESLEEAYLDIGSIFGYANQQAFLGYESFILDPVTNSDDNTDYFLNIEGNDFNQRYSYAATGYNGKFAFNASTQYNDKLYFGLNLNSHFLNFERSTFFDESNTNENSLVSDIQFDNYLRTTGAGFSFQLGGIAKLTEEFRLGLAFDSPTWFRITEETSQFLRTDLTDDGPPIFIDPFAVTIFPDYTLQTPGKLTGSLAYVFGDKGLISFDYSRKDYGNTKFKPKSDGYFNVQNTIISENLKAASTYRLGGEYRIKQFSLRGGYRFEESPYENERFYGDLSGYSLGLGYSFGSFKLDLAFDQSSREGDQRLYNIGFTDAATIDTKNSNITFSLGFNL